ncbi:methylase [Compostibacillus humi]|uniref:site-specific DNA-methyltransferase (adenine-specific) n=1 Tax=Compostibacillus humi TaxID=1245525 RepID=A0A8J3EKA6_9BACI|nr:DNA methyltransferase [Compostibacillus humi]GGH71540.1 methylase [Compostibacillus humi]
MNIRERKKAAEEFYNRWANRGNERQDSQSFWLDLLQNVYGIENPVEYISFEDSIQNMMDKTSFIDGYIEKTKVLIEQKGRDRDLNKGIRQSDGSYLTPFQQALRYSASLPYSKRPRWIITCNFKEFYIYDMEKPNSEPAVVKLENLKNEYYRLEMLVEKTNIQIEKETKVSIKAGELIGKIYDELLKQYKEPENPDTLKSINQLCVRLVFCFYAEDAGLFGKKGILYDYLSEFSARHFRNAIIDLFEVLNTKEDERDPYLDETLARFPYVNGDLFKDTDIEIPQFNERLRELILDNASSGFDWSEISPTIFGAVFESTLNPELRRDGGMHYTSIENIHKVIDPLFLDDLKNELNEIKQYKQPATIRRRAKEFQKKLGSLKFLDPAAGSGNFLTETYLALRKLENEAIKLYMEDNVRLDVENLIQVKLNQFYGIEINDFAVSVAKTALWIAESQMFEETQSIIYANMEFLPLESYTNIVQGNSLEMNWNNVIDKRELDYIIGNPPFVGARLMSEKQTNELKDVFGKLNGVGNLDYVVGWYGKAAQFINQSNIKCAFVSTNSITQGQQVPILWKYLMEEYNIVINFAYRTFNWNSEAIDKAAVHCVIIGFSQVENRDKKIYVSKEQVELANNINGYLLDAPNVFIENRRSAISKVPEMVFGSMPNDGGNLILTPEEKDELIKNYPQSKQVIKRFVGSREYINGIERYCLWIEPKDLNLISNINPIMERIKKVKEHRLNSKRKNTQELAKKPYAFGEIRQPNTHYLIVPRVSSENRRYIPIGYLDKNVIASDAVLIIPNASKYHFAILSSNVHMSWMRTVAGRLKSDYRYSASIVYNNFPWIQLTEEQKEKLTKTADNILKARELYPEMSLADLYNELIMPPELRKAHQDNDRLVMRIYGMDVRITKESDAVEKLFKMYNEMTKNIS